MSVRYGLLALLERQPMYGYQLRHEFEASTGATWPLNVGQVYSTLTRLQRDGLVEESSDGDEAQHVYAISDAGRREVRAWFAAPVRHDSPPRNELAIKLALAVRTPNVDVQQVIQAQRASTIRMLQEYTRAREAAAEDLSWQLVADSLIFAAEAEVRWLDHCETALVRASATPPASSDVSQAVSRRRNASRTGATR